MYLRTLHLPSLKRRGLLSCLSGQLADIWCLYPNKHRLVCQFAQHPLSSVAVCDAARQPILRGGCICTHTMTRRAAIRLPSTLSHFPSAGTGETGASGSNLSSLWQSLCAKGPRDQQNVSRPTLETPPNPEFWEALLMEVAAVGMMPTLGAGFTIACFEERCLGFWH